MQCTVFYSWQFDLPNATNRGFIQDALERATKAVRNDSSIQVEPVVDRDTAGVSGAPDIAATIFAKIDQAAGVVCDVSIVTGASGRPIPNPNVLVELGYALKSRGPERILLVINEAFGGVSQLPFDLRGKRTIRYTMPADAGERAPERQRLQRAFEDAIRAMLQLPHPETRTRSGHVLSAEARELLMEAVKDRAATVLVISGQVVTNQREFTTGDFRSRALWGAGVRDLVNSGLLEPVGRTGEAFRVTNDGYSVAGELGSTDAGH